MKTETHQKKIQILGRLIKESSLTLEEALLLLEHEEEEQAPAPTYVGGSATPYPGYMGSPYFNTQPLTGTITIPNNTMQFSTTGVISSTTFNTTNTAGFAQSVLEDLKNATEDADL